MLINPIKVIPLVLYSVVINLCLFVLACNTEQAEPAYLLNVGMVPALVGTLQKQKCLFWLLRLLWRGL